MKIYIYIFFLHILLFTQMYVARADGLSCAYKEIFIDLADFVDHTQLYCHRRPISLRKQRKCESDLLQQQYCICVNNNNGRQQIFGDFGGGLEQYCVTLWPQVYFFP